MKSADRQILQALQDLKVGGMGGTAITLALKNVSVQVSGTVPVDLGVIAVPSNFTRYRLAPTASTAALCVMFLESAAGAVNPGSFALFEQPNGGGLQLIAQTNGPTTTVQQALVWPPAASLFSASRTMYVRQITNSLSQAVMSFYVIIWPLN